MSDIKGSFQEVDFSLREKRRILEKTIGEIGLWHRPLQGDAQKTKQPRSFIVDRDGKSKQLFSVVPK